MDDITARLTEALKDAIGDQARTYMARVTNAGAKANGHIQAYSETHGTITVLCRTTDKIKTGDRIMVRKSSPEKHAPFVYSGFGGGADGAKMPGIEAPVYVEPPKDDGSGNADADTIQAYLDKIVTVLKSIKGTETWDQTIGQSLMQLVTWRAPVLAPSDLPSSGNRIGDVR
jgi:hypothetical protein